MSVSLPRTRIKSLEELVKQFEIDLEAWEVDRFTANAWEVGAKDEQGRIITEPLYQVKAHLKRRRSQSAIREQIELMKEEIRALIPETFKRVQRFTKPEGRTLELNISDHHFGKLAWSPETGGPSYDFEIAVKLYIEAFDSLLERAAPYGIGRVLLPLGNDIFHIDDRRQMTTAGTPQDADTRYDKLFPRVRRLVTEQINRVRRNVGPVEVVLVRGNHDYNSVFHLGDSLECTFDGCEDVKIDNTPTQRKYWHWGKNLVMFTHGNEEKFDQLWALMATERATEWAASTTREAHTGHRHGQKLLVPALDQDRGLVIRQFPSLTPADWWHASKGYTMNQRVAQGIVWDQNEGVIGIAQYRAPDEVAG